MKYIIDIDGTICDSYDGDYINSIPKFDRIDKINKLYDDNIIVYWTARGSNSGIDWSEHTTQQLSIWGCRYHQLLFNKPMYDLWIDDKAINSMEYFK